MWGERTISTHHCPSCGCTTHWQTQGHDYGKMGINARLLDGFDPAAVEVRVIDRASRWVARCCSSIKVVLSGIG